MSTPLSKAERAEALRHLDGLERAIQDLEDAGLNVEQMQDTAIKVRRELESQDDYHILEMWLRSCDTYQVISYRVQFPGNDEVYSFAAIKIGLTWYTSARTGRGTFGSADLARWMSYSVTLVDCVRMVPDGECHHVSSGFNRNGKGQRPDVEMGRR
jgi:hypothetical protein